MAKFASTVIQDAPLLAIKNGAIRMRLLKAYTYGDSFATMMSNVVSSVVMAPGDFTIASSGNNRTLTVAAKSVAASAIGGAGDHHVCLDNNVDTVYLVTDETGEAAVAVNDTNNFPSWVFTSPAPT